jgi:hypothetical protein
MTADVSCPGRWVLYSALQRVEAGEFFAIGGKPKHTLVRETAWKIRVVDGFVSEVMPQPGELQQAATLPDAVISQLRNALAFHYPYTAATATPSKQTATQRKGRLKDNEVAENAAEQIPNKRIWRKPGFAANSGMVGLFAYGYSIKQMYKACTDNMKQRNIDVRIFNIIFVLFIVLSIVNPTHYVYEISVVLLFYIPLTMNLFLKKQA